MQILLSILFPAAVSQVKSAGFACSKYPAHSTLYGLAQKVSNWKPDEIPDASMGAWTVQQLIDIILPFKKQYEVEEDEKQCDSLLCKQEKNFWWLERSHRQQWSNIPPEYRVVLEDYIDQVGRAVYNLSSEFCQAAGPKIQQLTEQANHLQKSVSDCHLDYLADLQEFISDNYLKRFDGVDKIKCRALDSQLLQCLGGDDFNDVFQDTLSEQMGEKISLFSHECRLIKNELESMKGPGIECSFF